MKKFGLYDKLPKKIAEAGDSPLDPDKVKDGRDPRNSQGDVKRGKK